MRTADHSIYPSRSAQVGFYLACGVAYPFFLAAETLQRSSARAAREGAPWVEAPHSVFVAARDSTFIAISYALMARTTLQKFGRQNRTERLS
jgi:hypothetical protein